MPEQMWFFSQSKRDAAIAQFALDKATTKTVVYVQTANQIADLLRAFFDAPASQKLKAQKVGSANGLTGDTPQHPLPPKEG